MAPLPIDNTRRWWLDYSVCTKEHSLLMRSIDTVDAVQASDAIDAFLTALNSQLRLVTVLGLRMAPKSSSISAPAVWSGAATYGSGAGSPFESANFIDFLGRTSGGRRARAGMFGAINAQVGGDYRVTNAESTFVGDALTALAADPDCFQAIDDFAPTWYQYANIGASAYWRNKIR